MHPQITIKGKDLMNCFKFAGFFLFCLSHINLFAHDAYLADSGKSKIDYWNIQRKGANYFNRKPDPNWFVAAKQTGIQFVRVAADKWKSQGRDFLIGDADAFKEIPAADFEVLKNTLDEAKNHNIKVVLTFLSLPGSRWRQNNQGNDDLRIWEQKEYLQQTVLFWKNLANKLKDHPAVAGYNILNEPHPECLFGIDDYRNINFDDWYASVKNSLADLNLFYKDIVKAIREVDSFTPIIVDTGLYATPWAISYLDPIQDEKIIYSFHMYEPYAYTTRKVNQGRFTYPGNVPTMIAEAFAEKLDSNAALTLWNSKALEQFLLPVALWQKKYNVPASRMLVGEFGCDRMSKGSAEYLENLIAIFNDRHWHWAFYSFREDCWDCMDYELGPDKLPWKYWEAAEQGLNLDEFRKDNPLFDVIKKDLLRTISSYNLQ
jgi:endoglucanase